MIAAQRQVRLGGRGVFDYGLRLGEADETGFERHQFFTRILEAGGVRWHLA